ncbi:hypothetical protein CRM22_005651 [Opisthorchis felineus]|uniref:Peptidase M12B domain-containing protein n=1 Tax=Opisthorchis felineus TaxID=147828 RepID=A0A4V3SET3_OPIFE|nr:hypothetical protein CRM22_005651 [Opisthorchis felineus]
MLAWILGVTILQTDLLAQYTGVGQHESATVTLSQLQDYDIINQIKFRSLRSTAGGSTVRRVAFSTRYNSWDLRLTRAESFISPDFSVTLLNQKGARKLTLGIDHLWHYTGDVYGQNESHVSAFFDEITHSFSARIFVGSKVYFMEPIRTYGEDHDNDSLVFYDLKDIKPPLINNTSVCDSGSLVNDSSAFSAGGSSFSKSSERKRRSGILQDKKLCRLSFIADYTFFTNVGSRSSPKTTRLIISLFYRINSLFQATKFLVDEADEQSGYGFLLGDIIIHESWNNELGHYNARSDANGKPWTPRSLSTAFSYAQFNRTCLAHLLTYRPFMGVLGRAWTAAPELGGICSPSRTERGEEFKTNTGWTTYADYSGRRLLNAMAELITAHELGHNWGAAHDPDTEECSPPAHSRGKYLMYAHSVAGFAVNNYLVRLPLRRLSVRNGIQAIHVFRLALVMVNQLAVLAPLVYLAYLVRNTVGAFKVNVGRSVNVLACTPAYATKLSSRATSAACFPSPIPIRIHAGQSPFTPQMTRLIVPKDVILLFRKPTKCSSQFNRPDHRTSKCIFI